MDKYFIVGPMGAGKSTIGLLLAEALNLHFVDVDREIETRAGADIPWIFDVEGEAGFRRRESQLLDELSQRDQIVLATGGGAVMKPENRQCLNRGFVIYLKTSVEAQLSRTRNDKRRPLLASGNQAETLSKLIAVRAPVYESLSDLTVETDGKQPRQVVKELMPLLEKV